MVEKPICLTKNQFNKIQKALLKNKVIISSNMVLRTNPRFNYLKNSIYSSINDIYYIDTEYLWGRPEKLEGWRRNTADYSIILDINSFNRFSNIFVGEIAKVCECFWK